MKLPRTALFMMMVAVLAAPHITHAHGKALMTLTAQSSGYFIDMDYSEKTFLANDRGAFTYYLFSDATRATPVPFTSLFVNISKTVEGSTLGQTVFAAPVNNPEQMWALVYAFPSGGEYTLTVTYLRGDTTLASTAFVMHVADVSGGPESGSAVSFGRDFWIGIFLGVILVSAVFIARKALTRGRVR